MLNSVILTVRMDRMNIECDMELPAGIYGDELCAKLLMALKSIDPGTFNSIEAINIRIKRTGKLLADGDTLETAEVWDGSIVTVERKAR